MRTFRKGKIAEDFEQYLRIEGVERFRMGDKSQIASSPAGCGFQSESSADSRPQSRLFVDFGKEVIMTFYVLKLDFDRLSFEHDLFFPFKQFHFELSAPGREHARSGREFHQKFSLLVIPR